jgi:membrane protein YqaA with SNARE-associated domain
VTESTGRGGAAISKRSGIWAFAWGLAESTFFFIVPDVYITRVALQDLRRALIACVFATAGALLGGAVLWGLSDIETGPRLLRAFTYLPGINRDLIAHAGSALNDQGIIALFSGMFRGQPYKLFAVHAGVQEISLALFLAFSVFAQLGRFIAAATLAWLCGRVLRGQPPRVLFQIHALSWLVFYLSYFFVMR